MKYIARCMLNMKGKRCSTPCVHCSPHEFNSVKYDEYDKCVFSLDEDHECNCVPLGLKYYMKEVLDEDKNK